ncbi:Outer membrane protein assembly factor BamB (plasmid) [Streptomyces sp. enrichment culture]
MGRYKIVARLGSGGMGQVYLARSPGGRPVAVKVVRPELAVNEEFRRRFKHEVMAAQRVNGAFTAGVVDADLDGSPAWLATVYVPGISLGEAITVHGPWPTRSVLALAAGLVEALEVIHAADVIHRDLKPTNVLLASDGPRIIDFGISVAMGASALTNTGMLVGTPGFMSPEQITGGSVGPASDVFALGAVLTYSATGVGPFGAGSPIALHFRTVHEQPDLGNLEPKLRDVVAACLAKHPEQRPTVVTLLNRLISASSDGGSTETHPRTLLLAKPSWMPDRIAEIVRQNDSLSPLPQTLHVAPGGSRRRKSGLPRWSLIYGKERWWAMRTSLQRPPAVADGVIFVGSRDQKLYALYADAPEERWSFTTGGKVWSSPTVANGLVYIGSDDRNLYAVDADTGRQRWSFTTGGKVRSSPTVANGLVYIGSDDRNLYAVDADTGRQRWSFTTGGKVWSSPTVANGLVYIGSDDRNLYAVDADTGRQRWSFTTGGKVWSSPTVANGLVYIGSDDRNLYAVDADTGRQRWSFTTGGEAWGSSPTAANGLVYMSSGQKVHAVDAGTGLQCWTFTIGSEGEVVNSTPTVNDGLVYFAGNDQKLYAVDAGTGQERWSFGMGEWPHSAPVVDHGLVYIACVNNTLHAVQT